VFIKEIPKTEMFRDPTYKEIF